MKELSIEEKLRDIEVVKQMIADGHISQDVAEKYFPELKESEDVLTWLTRYISEEAYCLSMDIRDNEDRIKLKNLQNSLAWLKKQGDKDKLIQELGKYKVKYMQEVLEKHINSMGSKEDERIRKALISILKSDFEKDSTIFDISVEQILAWLEKMGVQNYKIIKGKNYFCVKTHNYAGVEWIKDTKYYASDDYTLVNQGCEYYCPEYSKEEHNNLFEEVKCDGCVEKQGEQKPVDKFEAKFHEGDKLISTINPKSYL